MSFLKSNLKNILILTAILAGSFYLYSYFFSGVEESSEILSVTSNSASSSDIGGDLLVILSDLKSTKLDQSIFSDPAFQGLKNFRVELGVEPIGRNNPFAPIQSISQTPSSPGIKIKNFDSN